MSRTPFRAKAAEDSGLRAIKGHTRQLVRRVRMSLRPKIAAALLAVLAVAALYSGQVGRSCAVSRLPRSRTAARIPIPLSIYILTRARTGVYMRTVLVCPDGTNKTLQVVVRQSRCCLGVQVRLGHRALCPQLQRLPRV